MTQVLGQLKNDAQLSASAAQAALEAVSKAGNTPSAEALQAMATANQAALIWGRYLEATETAGKETQAVAERLRIMEHVEKQASKAYTQAVLRVQDFPPYIPAVRAQQFL